MLARSHAVFKNEGSGPYIASVTMVHTQSAFTIVGVCACVCAFKL